MALEKQSLLENAGLMQEKSELMSKLRALKGIYLKYKVPLEYTITMLGTSLRHQYFSGNSTEDPVLGMEYIFMIVTESVYTNLMKYAKRLKEIEAKLGYNERFLKDMAPIVHLKERAFNELLGG